MEIAKALLLETLPCDVQVFDHGDVGHKFYIILKGSVSVQLPIDIHVSPEERQKRLELYENHQRGIDWATDGILKLKNRIKKIKAYKKVYGDASNIPQEYFNIGDSDMEDDDED